MAKLHMHCVETMIRNTHRARPLQSYWSLVFQLFDEDLAWMLKVLPGYREDRGRSVCLLRDDLGLTMQEMATLWGVSIGAIASLEAGERKTVKQHHPSLCLLIWLLKPELKGYGIELMLKVAERKAGDNALERVWLDRVRSKLLPANPSQ